MELRHLRCFEVLAQELHFGRAAERLHIEASPLSRAIKELEGILGVKLFDRTTRRTVLTGAGQVLLGRAGQILREVEQTQSMLAVMARQSPNCLRLGLSDGVAGVRLARWLSRLRREESHVELQVQERPYGELVKAVRQGQLDAGLALSEEAGDGVQVDPLWRNPLVAVFPTDHPLRDQDPLALADVLRHPLILYHPEQGSGCARQLREVLSQVGASANVVSQVNSLAMVLTMVAAGYGVGFALRSHASVLRRSRLVVRRLAEPSELVTYLLRPDRPMSELLGRCLSWA
jgi:DNA-binding transcriptional LysR family regulator